MDMEKAAFAAKTDALRSKARGGGRGEYVTGAPLTSSGRSSLVLRRGVGEGIWIGEDIYVEVAEIKGNLAKLRIVAPTRLSIDRHEVREQQRSAKASGHTGEAPAGVAAGMPAGPGEAVTHAPG